MTNQERINTNRKKLDEIPIAYRGLDWRLASLYTTEAQGALNEGNKATCQSLLRKCRPVLKDATL